MNSTYLYPLYSYILGSIPFGLILSNCFGNGLLRKTGSKNIGATNVMRTQGRALGILTFLLDFFKGFCACYFFRSNDDFLNLAVTAAVVIGHMFPLWLWFRGGKGIATYFGMLGALNIYVLALTGAIWIAVFFIYRISAVAGMVSVICSCFIFKLMPYADHYYASGTRQLYVLMALTLLIIAKHHENIRELLEKRKPPPQKQ